MNFISLIRLFITTKNIQKNNKQTKNNKTEQNQKGKKREKTHKNFVVLGDTLFPIPIVILL